MSSASQASIARFASLPGTAVSAPGQRTRLFQLFVAPFGDVDQRVALKLAASRAEREARQAAMSGAGEPRLR
jgi:hypothetical protein